MSASKPEQQGWRGNLEALTMAIAVALLFKYFILEISKIPSGSMQPTLMGSPEASVFDRTVVDKLSYCFRDPERFEIVVFKHPLERSRVMVKRLVGMPGEELKIEHGDLWTRQDESEPWRILRRPPDVQRRAWRELRSKARGEDWDVVRGGDSWSAAGDGVRARGAGAVRFRDQAGAVRDFYLDGYPSAIVDKIQPRDPSQGRNAVGDLRLTGRVRVEAGTSALGFQLTEGQNIYEFSVPGPAAAADARLEVRIRNSVRKVERTERGASIRFAADEALAFALENLDDRLAFELDGQEVFAAEIEASEQQEAKLTLSLEDGGADFSALRVARDVYYLTPENREAWVVKIPPRSYVMLGDNTQDSADSRLWQAKSYTPKGGEDKVRGNYREGNENPSFGVLVDGSPGLRFRDEWGEVHWFPRRGVDETLPGGAPLVPRELVLGRALAIFWPIQPTKGLWRIGWLH